MTDAQAISRILAGEEELFADLVERYTAYAWALSAGYIRHGSDREDVVQESFVHCYRRLNTIRDPAAFPCWFGRLVRSQCLTWLRARSRRENAMERYTTCARSEGCLTAEPPDEALSRDELRAGILAKMGALSVKYRESLSLHYIGGYTAAEIAQFLGVTTDAVKKRLELGRKRLRGILEVETVAALASDGPSEDLRGRILAVIPFGQASWLLPKGQRMSEADTGASTARAATAFKAATALVVIIAAAGLVYIVASRHKSEATPSVKSVQEEVALVAKPAPAPITATTASHSHRPSHDGNAEESAGQRLLAKTLHNALANAATTPPEERQKNPIIEKALDTRVSIEFEGQSIVNIVEFLSQYLKVNIAVDRRVLKTSRGTRVRRGDDGPTERCLARPDLFGEYATDGMVEHVRVDNVSALEMLEYVLYPLGLDFVEEPGFIWISTPDKIHKEVVPLPDERYDRYNIEKKLASPLGLVFEGEHVMNILEFVGNYLNMNVAVDSRVVQPPEKVLERMAADEQEERQGGSPTNLQVTDGIVYYIDMNKIALRDVLPALLRPLNLAYSVENGYIWISSPKMLAREAGVYENIPGQNAPFMGEAVELFCDVPDLATTCQLLAAAFDKEFTLDAAAIPHTPAATDDVLNVALWNTNLRDGLNVLLRPFGLSFTVAEDTVFISTPERLKQGSLEPWNGSSYHGDVALEEVVERKPGETDMAFVRRDSHAYRAARDPQGVVHYQLYGSE